MKFWEAMKIVDEGGSACRSSYNKWRVQLDGEYPFGMIMIKGDKEKGATFRPFWQDMIAEDWEEVDTSVKS